MKAMLLVLVSMIVGAEALSQTKPSVRIPPRAIHTILVGDCDTTRAVTAYADALQESAESNTIALIEFAPAKVDPHKLTEMLRATSARSCTLVLKIIGPANVDARVLSLAFTADACVIDDRVVFTSTREADTVRDDTEHVLALRAALVESGTPEDLARVLTFGAREAFISSSGRVVCDQSSDSSEDLTLLRDGVIRVDHNVLSKLPLKHHAEIRHAWKALGRGTVRVESPSRIHVGASNVAKEADRRLADVRASLSRMDASLDLPDPSKREVAPTKYRIAADQAMQIAEGVERILDEIETSFQQAPEALAIAPEDEPALGSAETSYAGAWKSRIRTQRSALERLKARATEFASVKP